MLNTVTISFSQPADNIDLTADVTSVPADGVSKANISVTVTDPISHAPLAGRTVTLAETGPGSASIHGQPPGIPANAVTDAMGVAHFEVTDRVIESVSFTATEV